MISLLAQADPANSHNVIIWTLVVTNVVAIFGMVVKAWFERENRIQDRLDRESQARIQLEAGERRKTEILAATESAKAESREALRVANGHNEKIAKAMEAVKEATALPKEVVIVNPPERPVHTTKGMESPEL